MTRELYLVGDGVPSLRLTGSDAADATSDILDAVSEFVQEFEEATQVVPYRTELVELAEKHRQRLKEIGEKYNPLRPPRPVKRYVIGEDTNTAISPRRSWVARWLPEKSYII